MSGTMGWSTRMRRWLCGSLVAASVWLTGGEAKASGEHQVPDLRQEPGKKWQRSTARVKIALTVHVATESLDRRRLERALKQTNAALRSFGIEVHVGKVIPMPPGYSQVRHRRHRRALAEYAPIDGTIHVFMVDHVELGSVLRANRGVRGLHWRYRGLRRKLRDRQYLVIGGDAPPTTLVHEIGHLFGLDHDPGQQNLMCSCREGPKQVFTRAQGVEIFRGATQFVRGSG